MAVVSAHKKDLDDLEKSSEAIRRDFDQFFLGLSKRPPTSAQAQLAGLFRKLKEEEIKEWNTQDKFRFNQIHARFVSLERVWARTLKQIEDGTYKRDKFKVAQARKRDAQLAEQQQQQQPGRTGPQPLTLDPLDAIDVDMDGFDEPAPAPKPVAPRPAPRPVAAPAPVPLAAAANDLGGLSEQKLQQLHKVYVDAKKRTGEASSLTLEALRAQVAKQVPVIRAKHNCEAVDFKVVLKDGKAMLKAIPK